MKKKIYLKFLLVLPFCVIVPLIITACASGTTLVPPQSISPTIIKDTYNGSVASDSVLKNTTTEDNINEDYVKLKQWIFDNEIDGNKDNLSSNDVNIEIISSNKLLGIFELKYGLKRFWSEKELVQSSLRPYKLIIIGFKPMVLGPQDELMELKKSGEFNNIKYSSYFAIAGELNLSQTTRLNIFNDIGIALIISKSNPEFKDIKLVIKSGEQAASRLVLGISGIYKNLTITPEDIIITGFFNTLENYGVHNEMKISDFKIDFDKYHNSLQTLTTALTWNADNFFNYSQSVTARRIGFDLVNLTTLFNNKVLSANLINFNEVVNGIYNNAQIEIIYSNYSYENNAWKVVDTKKLIFGFEKITNKLFPTPYDALSFALKNNNKLNITEQTSIYASSVYAGVINDPPVANSFVQMDAKFLNTYFSANSNDKNYLEIKGDKHNTTADDTKGNLNLGVIFSLGNDIPIQISQTILIQNFKKPIDYINSNNMVSSNLISQHNATSAMRKRIIASIKKEIGKDKLQGLVDQEKIPMTSVPIYFRGGEKNYRLYNGENENVSNRVDAALLDEATFLFLDARFSTSSINSYKLYRTKSSGPRFLIENLSINFNDVTRPTMTKEGNSYVYRVNLQYEIFIMGASYIIDTNYFSSLLDSDFMW